MIRQLSAVLTAIVLLGLFGVACTQAQPTEPQTEKTGATKTTQPTTAATTAQADVTAEVEKPGSSPESKAGQSAPLASPEAAAPSPSPGTGSPVAQARGEPQGTLTYGSHVAITPAWFDPQEVPATITPWVFLYAMHDGLVKHLPGEPLAPSLAESYEIAEDFTSATFTLREGITFHNGDPVTPEDVKFSFENYRGGNASILKEKVERIETPDDRTVTFFFKEPFLDFLILYGSPASGAGWVVPKSYYEQVGPDGFKQNPIGAGPYKFVRFEAGSQLELEANADYWRKTPAVQKVIIRDLPEATTRLAALQTGEVDVINLVPGQLLETAQQDPGIELAPVQSAPYYLDFVDMQNPDNPFSDPRVREAASLALDRQAMSDAEEGGLSTISGTWIPEDWPGALQGIEAPPYDPERAKQLLAEAGYPDGFEVPYIAPVPSYFSWAERVMADLAAVGIRVQQLEQMERAVFIEKVGQGDEGFAPGGILLNASGAPGDAAVRIREFAICEGTRSRICFPEEIDARFQQYEQSSDPAERQRLITEIQQFILDQHIFPLVYRQAFVNAVGPRIENEWTDIFGAIPQYLYLGPFEDIELKQ